MKLKELLSGKPKPGAPVADPPKVALSADCTYFHVTHWKAASQWMRAILVDLFGSAVVHPEYHIRHVLAKPILAGKVYACAYVAKPEFDTLEIPGISRHFVLIRDLRDTLVSGYFSLRYSHEIRGEEMEAMRGMLNRLNEEEGMLYMMDAWLPRSARVQRTWLEAGAPCARMEDCVYDPVRSLDKLFQDHWDIQIPRPLLEEVAARHGFAKLSGGRAPGQEDAKSHYRKGMAGDWRSHFTSRVSRRFACLYDDLLIGAGYEEGPGWSAGQ